MNMRKVIRKQNLDMYQYRLLSEESFWLLIIQRKKEMDRQKQDDYNQRPRQQQPLK